MARRATLSLDVSIQGREETDVGALVARLDHALRALARLVTGTADGQIDRIATIAGTASSTPTDHDLSGGITSPLSAGAVSLAELVLFAIANDGTVPILIGGDTNDAGIVDSSGNLVVPAGGFVLVYAPAGVQVVNSSSDVLQVATASGTAAYRAIVAGRSA